MIDSTNLVGDGIETITVETRPADPSPNRLWSRLAAGISLIWILFVSFTSQLAAWLIPLLGLPGTQQGQAVLITAIQSALLMILLAPLALFWRAKRYRAVFRTWLSAAVFLLVLAPTRLLPATQSQLLTLAQTFVMLVVLLLYWKWPRNHESSRVSQPNYGMALAAAGNAT